MQNLVTTNQFFSCKSQNKVIANERWFKVIICIANTSTGSIYLKTHSQTQKCALYVIQAQSYTSTILTQTFKLLHTEYDVKTTHTSLHTFYVIITTHPSNINENANHTYITSAVF